jgi:hypothetical protein
VSLSPTAEPTWPKLRELADAVAVLASANKQQWSCEHECGCNDRVFRSWVHPHDPSVSGRTMFGVSITSAARFAGTAAAHGYYWSRIQNPNPQVWNEEEFNTSLYGTMMLVRGRSCIRLVRLAVFDSG